MQIELQNLAGAFPKFTTMWDGSARVVESHGRYADALARGNMYFVGDTGGKTAPAGLSTAPINVCLYNPLGSGVYLSLYYASANFLVAFAAAAAVWIGVNPAGSAAVTGTALAVQNANGTGGTGKVKAFTTATLPAVPTILADLGVGLTGAITTLPVATSLFRWFDGAIGVGPGGCLSLQVSTASGTSSALMNWLYEEVPLNGSGPTLTA